MGIEQTLQNILGYRFSFQFLSADSSVNSVNYQFLNIYSKRTNCVKTLSFTERQALFSLRPPLSFVGQGKFNLALTLVRDEIRFNNEKDLTSVITDYSLDYNNVNLRASFNGNRKLIYFDFGYGFAASDGIVKIRSYPYSNDELMNRFFLDWLEPTFGKRLFTRVKVSNMRLTTSFLKRGKILSPGFLVSKRISNNDIEIEYSNSSNKEELTGSRKLTVPFDINSSIVGFFLEDNAKRMVLSLLLFEDKIFLDTDNNPPAFTDFESLGYFKLYRKGVSISSLFKFKKAVFEAGASGYTFTSKLDMRTPVLGYFSKILPISHGVEGNIDNGKAHFWHLSLQNEHNFLFFKDVANISYSYGCLTSTVNGEAKLEFGLVSTPIHGELKYLIRLFDIAYRISLPLESLGIHFMINQFIPFVKRLDKSKIKFRKEYPDRKISYKGGFKFSISIDFPLD